MSFEGRESPDAKRIFECPGCHIRTYPEKMWKEMTAAERAKSGGRVERAGMCTQCARFPNRRDPEPGAPYADPVCAGCGHEMIMGAQWKRASQAERDELLAEGYVRYRIDEKCYDCIPNKWDVKSTLPPEQIAARKGQKGLTIQQYLDARSRGLTTIIEIAQDIGISSQSLRKAIKRARDAGQEIPA